MRIFRYPWTRGDVVGAIEAALYQIALVFTGVVAALLPHEGASPREWQLTIVGVISIFVFSFLHHVPPYAPDRMTWEARQRETPSGGGPGEGAARQIGDEADDWTPLNPFKKTTEASGATGRDTIPDGENNDERIERVIAQRKKARVEEIEREEEQSKEKYMGAGG